MSFDTKSILAKLMATENITVEERNTHTAFFDVQGRLLVVPILDQNISPELYDLFMGHEVGHALYTPIDGMKKAKEDGENMSIINVVEDARIERKIKYKYPGLKNSFIKGYNELIEKNFFETQGKDLNTLNFIDRVNIHFKGGAVHAIFFTEEEKQIVQAIENTETYEDVVDVSRRVVDYMKKQNEDSDNFHFSDLHYGEDGDDYEETDYSPDSNEENDDSDKDSNEKNESSAPGNAAKDEEKDKKEESASSGEKNSDIRSETDDAYKGNESKLFTVSDNEYVYVNIPVIEPQKCIFDYKNLYAIYKKDYRSGFPVSAYNEFRKDSSKVVSYLAKEFELRKNADQLKRASIAKTGELNMDRIYSYNFSEDLFKKMSIMPQGKSHGLVMFLDWSGSMQGHIGNTVKQLLNLTLFCRQVNIPFEVYAFIDQAIDNCVFIQKRINGDLNLGEFSLVNILSNRMSTKEFSEASAGLMYMTGIDTKQQTWTRIPEWFKMQGTPLNQSIIAAMEIIPEFQKRNKLNIVNAVFLTDGQGEYLSEKIDSLAWGGTQDVFRGVPYKKTRYMVMRDPKTKNQEKIEARYSSSQTTALIKLLKKRTRCNVLGFYVASSQEFKSRVMEFFPETRNNYNKYEQVRGEFRKNKFCVVKSVGYDEYYVLRATAMDTDDDNELVVKENATTRGLVTAFSKYAKDRIQNRVILNRFIGMIA